MSWVPAFEIGVWNAWWFMCVYLLQWLAVILAGPRLSQRTGASGYTEETSLQRKNSITVTVVWIIATLYSIFLPFYLGTVWFYTGLAFFLIGLAIVILATVIDILAIRCTCPCISFISASASLPLPGSFS
jgi:hypothetical protein